MMQRALRDVLRAGGVATGGSNITLVDTSVSWVTNAFTGTILKVLIGGVEYNTTITSNTATQLTFNALPPGIVVGAGTPYFFPFVSLAAIQAAVAAIAANLLLLMGDVGDASASTLGSLYAILGNPPAAQTFLAMIGFEGATALANKLTAARAALLDRIGLLAPGGAGQLTIARVGFLDNINNAQLLFVPNLSTLTAARIGYLDNINQAGLLQVTAARATLLDQITALRMAELDAANIPADVDTLLARLTALRAGYLDALAPAVNVPAVTEAVGNLNYNEASALEQTLLTLVIPTRARIGSLWFDMFNVTRIATIRLYHRIDGATYREFAQYSFNPAVDSDGVLIDGFTAYRNVQVSFQCDGLGAAVVVPYAVE
jgi:hypothetical protein